MNEALGLGLPIIAFPWPNVALARHPAFPVSIKLLRASGVTVLLDFDNLPQPDSGAPGAASFPWEDLRKELRAVRSSLGD
ncbi:hypothetical protein AB0B89_27945 [Sphaerisporangium sp. NPDC049002]|uniref:hypothetical protein n=1 Tax=unclassified Sphaerisporangium TaxID=2630420 RepID=UPI0033D75F91